MVNIQPASSAEKNKGKTTTKPPRIIGLLIVGVKVRYFKFCMTVTPIKLIVCSHQFHLPWSDQNDTKDVKVKVVFSLSFDQTEFKFVCSDWYLCTFTRSGVCVYSAVFVCGLESGKKMLHFQQGENCYSGSLWDTFELRSLLDSNLTLVHS